MKVAIAIDDYKLPVFKKHLDAAGFAFEQGPGITPDTINLYVITDKVLELGAVTKAANTEASRARKGKGGRVLH